jgi:hypothetical protein
MEVGASTLGDAARVNFTFSCTLGDAMWGAPLECREVAVAADQEE